MKDADDLTQKKWRERKEFFFGKNKILEMVREYTAEFKLEAGK
nr:hypothetical protein [Wolbachia endosymbiont of Atemnus politus]